MGKLKLKSVAAAIALAAVASTASATLIVRTAISGAALTVDATGPQGAGDGTLHAAVAAGSTVVAAYLYSADIFGSGVQSVVFNGTTFAPAGGTLLGPNANPANTIVYDVTSVVKPIIDGGPGGVYNFSLHENGNNDGEVLVVVYRNASTASSTAIIMDGELASAGDTTTLNFGSAYAGGDLVMSLASSFSFNGNSNVNSTGQVTTVDVATSSNPALRRLTSCAGGNDDGIPPFVAANGALITAGGFGDNPANPDPNCQGAAGDDELYNLALGNSANSAPFLSTGDTSVTFNTRNPSFDDNVFGLFFTSQFAITSVNDVPVDQPPSVPEPGSLALAGLGILALGAARRRKAVR